MEMTLISRRHDCVYQEATRASSRTHVSRRIRDDAPQTRFRKQIDVRL